jgi:hypothetical protein
VRPGEGELSFLVGGRREQSERHRVLAEALQETEGVSRGQLGPFVDRLTPRRKMT